MISKLQPNRVRRTYLGGRRIDAFCGTRPSAPRRQADGGMEPPRPEDWLASTTQAFNGALEIDGEGLGRLEDGRLVRDVAGALPILVKLLDSDERLVVQAHPTVPCARKLFNSPVGKTECWYFLPGTEPDACVYLGFKPGITREAWELAVNNCSTAIDSHRPQSTAKAPLLTYLHHIPVAPGDFVFVDGGVPHAIGGGCFMVELQEPSDLMVVAERFTPSGRRIPDAKMHGGVGWERMFDVYEYDGRTYEETCERYVRKCSQISNVHKSALHTNANCDCDFRLVGNEDLRFVNNGACRICGPDLTGKFQMWILAGGGALQLDGKPAVVVVTEGEGTLNGLPAMRGDRLVVSGESALAAGGSIKAVVCS